LRYKSGLNAKGVDMTDKTRGILLVLGLLAVATTAASCGGDGNDLAQFTGTWQYTDSQGTLSCPGSADQMGTLGSTKLWQGGVSSDLVDMSPAVLDRSTQCFYMFDIKDKVASVKAGQTCVITDGIGDPIADETPSAWTFTLTSATTAEEVLTTSVPPCTLTGMATLKKLATSN
jgi:hypothetical protein